MTHTGVQPGNVAECRNSDAIMLQENLLICEMCGTLTISFGSERPKIAIWVINRLFYGDLRPSAVETLDRIHICVGHKGTVILELSEIAC